MAGDDEQQSLAHLQSRQNFILHRILQLESRLCSGSHSPNSGSHSKIRVGVDGSNAITKKADPFAKLPQTVEDGRPEILPFGAADTSESVSVESTKPSNIDFGGLRSQNVEETLSMYLRTRGATYFEFKRVPPDYYNRTYEERRELLGAASVHHLCKSIVMVNTQAHESVKDCSDRNNSKYYVVVIQYVARLHAEKVKKFVYSLNKGKFPKTKFNMRLAPESDSFSLTGYEHNAVTPLNMRTDIPVILSENIAKLQPKFLWLGGGEVDLKLGMRVEEFINLVNPFVIDCTYPEED